MTKAFYNYLMNGEENKKLIFLIDDDRNFCNLFTLLLEKEKINVKCFFELEDALKALEDEIPNLILLDIAMPKINGFNCLIEIKKLLKDKTIPILFITNLDYTDNGQRVDEALARSFGADGLIHKTESLEEILKKIKFFL